MESRLEAEATAEVARKAQLAKAGEREQARLKKEPFKTMAEVVNPETLDALRGWVEPGYAYILLELPTRWMIGDGESRIGTSLTTMNLENRPEQESRFYYLTRKGARPIHYGNFPRHDHPNASRSIKAKHHTGPDHINPWNHMAGIVRQQMLREQGRTELEVKSIGLEAKLEAAREEIAKLKKGKNDSTTKTA